MTKLNLEKAAADRRMRARGTESVHKSGLALTRDLPSRRAAEALANRIDAWKQEKTIEQLADERAAIRAPQEAHTHAILEACED